MKPIDIAADRSSRRFDIFCLIVTLTLLICRLTYRGIRHDAVLYMGQALARVNPAWADGDFFFAFGSQDRYSLFSLPRAWLLTHASTPLVDMATILLAWILFVGALIALVWGLSPRLRWLGVMTVVAASHYYGSARIFSFMEPFLTARTLAEPAALIGLACLVRGRRVPALCLLVLALMLHPLIALPMAMVFFCYQVAVDRRWAWLLALVIPVVGLAFAKVAPFSALLRLYDENWWHAVLEVNYFVLMSRWSVADFVATLANFGVLALACRGRTDALARAGRAALVAGAVLCTVSYVGASLLQDVLITQLQLWRVMWIVDVLALLNLPLLLAREWARGPNGRLAAIAVFVGYFEADCYFGNSWAIVAWAIAMLVLSARGTALKPRVVLLAAVATLAVGLSTTGIQAYSALGQLNLREQGMAIARVSSIPFVLPILTLPAMLALLLAWERGGAARAAGVAATVVFAVIGFNAWDQRTPWERYVESATPGSHPFARLIPPGAEVYWHGDLLATWLLLQRPNYISETQLSGLLFNRDTAYVGTTRLPYLRSMRTNMDRCIALSRFGADIRQLDMCRIERKAFFDMCSAEPTRPDFLVASDDFGKGVVANWRFTPEDGSQPTDYRLYDCAKIR